MRDGAKSTRLITRRDAVCDDDDLTRCQRHLQLHDKNVAISTLKKTASDKPDLCATVLVRCASQAHVNGDCTPSTSRGADDTQNSRRKWRRRQNDTNQPPIRFQSAITRPKSVYCLPRSDCRVSANNGEAAHILSDHAPDVDSREMLSTHRLGRINGSSFSKLCAALRPTALAYHLVKPSLLSLRSRRVSFGFGTVVLRRCCTWTVVLILISLILGLLAVLVLLQNFSPTLRFHNDDAAAGIDDENAVQRVYERLMRRPELRFGAARAKDVELWIVDVGNIEARPRRRRRVADFYTVGERNLASDCGDACTLRLRHPLTHDGVAVNAAHDVAVEFRRWKAPPTLPFVQLLDADANRSTVSRPFSAPTACIYTASVRLTPDRDVTYTSPRGIVNLCGEDGGMFGMLALADAGTFAIEPLLGAAGIPADDEAARPRARHRRTLEISRLRTAHLIYRLLPQRYDTTAPTGAATLSSALTGVPLPPSTQNDLNFFSDIAEYRNALTADHTRRSTDAAFAATNFTAIDTDLYAPPSHFPSPTSLPNAVRQTSSPRIILLHENKIFTHNASSAHFDNSRRARRAATSWDNYVEVLVVADYRMLLYHQRNLENYVLTLFSTVASIYRHPSLGASINIVVVRLIILKHERAGPQVSARAQETLQQFCAWQQNYNDPNDGSPSHHDVAILLTRHDICRATNKCDTLGLAELGTMCDSQKSCAIIEDNGLSAAFTIAHELGHILNIPHDDERKCGEFMPLNKNNYHIMAPTLEYNTNPWSWSPCSAHMLSKFLDTHRSQAHCILDQPVERRYYERMFETAAPGAIYSVNQQCQFVFGAGAEICPYMPTCRRLWCSVSYGYQMGCRTQHMPWADGTPCGDDMWCHSGHCVGMSPRQRQKQDGAWGEWKPWRECSRSCGGGVQKALRDCENPRPANGGRYCVGQRERYRSCNVQDCSWDAPGFREAQCAAFDGRDVGIHGVPPDAKWLPKYTGIGENERCQLYCRQSGSAAFYLLRDKVQDGTPCDQSTDDICIDGVCHKAGCDHRLGSEMRRDGCGICGGDGTTCHTVHGTYNERGTFGYNDVVRLPAGAANIDIRQTAYNNANDDDNYLALRSANGDFLLNGHYQVSVFRQQVYVLDAVLEYSGSDHATERLNGTGPLRADVYLQVLSVGQLNPSNIQYTFTVPIATPSPSQEQSEQQSLQHQQQQEQQPDGEQQSEQQQQQQSAATNELAVDDATRQQYRGHHHRINHARQPQAPTATSYHWRHTDAWTDCSTKCQGTQTQRTLCVEQLAQRVVEDQLCASAHPLTPQLRACNIDCFNKWIVKTVMTRDGPTRQVVCVRVFTNGGNEFAPEEECRAAGVNRPNLAAAPAASSSANAYVGRWVYSEYAACSVTCGSLGVAHRQARCVDAVGGEIDTRHCDPSLREPTQASCNRTSCPRWTFGQWSECSRSCGGGVRVRHAICQDAGGAELDSQLCPAAERVDLEDCNKAPCTQWDFGQWSACTAICGRGVQRREARCVELSTTANVGRVAVDESRCDARLRIVEQECVLATCPHWYAGAWSTCSVTCGDGFMTRAVACLGANDVRLSDRACTPSGERPASHQPCSHGLCPQWRIRDWSQCSVKCGTGVRQRDVACLFREQVVDDSLCVGGSGGVTPARHETCTLLACANWDTRPWGACSVTCGAGGIQRRVVQCTRGTTNAAIFSDWECDVTTRPQRERSCERDACPTSKADFRWDTGAWSECSVTCGHGTRQRLVQCVGHGRHDLSDDYCRHLNTPRPSNTDACSASKECVSPPPPMAQWRVSTWTPACPTYSAFMLTCQVVVQRRHVFCEVDATTATRRRRKSLPDEECVRQAKPTDVRDCELPPACRQAHALLPAKTTVFARWDTGNWSTCSASCGGGWRRRSVECVENNTAKIPRSALMCRDTRPAEFEPCNTDACATVTWQTDKWSTCSVTCGVGRQRRRVWCRSEVLAASVEVNVSACAQTGARKPDETRECQATNDCDGTQENRTASKRTVTLAHTWRPGQWSACSQSCGRGVRTRTVACVSLDNERPANASRCAGIPRPASTHRCRETHCARWHTSNWSLCSVSCGSGVSRREVYCQLGRHRLIADSECVRQPKPYETRVCQMTRCSTYQWHISTWSRCAEMCRPSEQHRRVYCIDDSRRYASDAMCRAVSDITPISRRVCSLSQCPYRWIAGEWSTCSRTCGTGHRFRKIKCHILSEKGRVNASSSRSTHKNSPSSITSTVVASRFCIALEKPTLSESCQLSPCKTSYQ